MRNVALQQSDSCYLKTKIYRQCFFTYIFDMMHSVAQMEQLNSGISRVKGLNPTGATLACTKKRFTHDNGMKPELKQSYILHISCAESSRSFLWHNPWEIQSYTSEININILIFCSHHLAILYFSAHLLINFHFSHPSSLLWFPMGGARRPVIWLSWLVWSNTCPLSGEGGSLSARNRHVGYHWLQLLTTVCAFAAICMALHFTLHVCIV